MVVSLIISAFGNRECIWFDCVRIQPYLFSLRPDDVYAGGTSDVRSISGPDLLQIPGISLYCGFDSYADHHVCVRINDRAFPDPCLTE